jgi:hypothetical protein
MKIVRASAEELFGVIESLSERLASSMGEEAFKRHFPELAGALEGAASEGISFYDGSGKFGFTGSS